MMMCINLIILSGLHVFSCGLYIGQIIIIINLSLIYVYDLYTFIGVFYEIIIKINQYFVCAVQY